jgi:hypothetical protein
MGGQSRSCETSADSVCVMWMMVMELTILRSGKGCRLWKERSVQSNIIKTDRKQREYGALIVAVKMLVVQLPLSQRKQTEKDQACNTVSELTITWMG